MNELELKIAELTIEIDRIKKTSKQRFERNKKLESNKVYVDGELFKIKCINDFLIDNGFKLEKHRGIPMVNYSVFSAIKSLQQKGKKAQKPEVDGVYSVKIGGEWQIRRVEHRICWMFIGEDEKQKGIHFYNTEEFILLES